MWPVRAVLGSARRRPCSPSSRHSGSESANEAGYVDAFLSPRGASIRCAAAGFVDVAFESADPAFAVARGQCLVAEEYVSQNLEIKVESLEKSLEWLTAEVGKQQQQVQASERALAEYRERQDAGALADNQNIVVARLNQLSDAVTQGAERRASQKEASGTRCARPARTATR